MIDMEWRDLWSLRLDNPLDDAETLLMDRYGYVTELGKKPQSYKQIEGQYTGLIKIRADKLEAFIVFYNQLNRSAIYDGKDFNNMYMTTFIQIIIDNLTDVNPVFIDGGWVEIDCFDDMKSVFI